MAANRANAQKSTGPRTEAGKRRSRYNAVVHGATASLSVLPGEDPRVVKRFIDRVYEDLRPRGQAEAVLVDQYASVAWKLRRLGAAERAVTRRRFFSDVHEVFETRDNIQWMRKHAGNSPEALAELDEEEASLPKGLPDALTPWDMVAEELTEGKGKGPLLRLIELETRLHGTMSNVLKQLKDLQALRTARQKEERGDDAEGDDGWKPGEWDVDAERWCDDVPDEDKKPAPAPAPRPRPEGPELQNEPNAAPAPEPPEPPAGPPQVDAPPADATAPSNGDGAATDAAPPTGEPAKATDDVEPPMTPISTDAEGEKPPSEPV